MLLLLLLLFLLELTGLGFGGRVFLGRTLVGEAGEPPFLGGEADGEPPLGGEPEGGPPFFIPPSFKVTRFVVELGPRGGGELLRVDGGGPFGGPM